MKFLSNIPFHTFLLAAATVLSFIIQVKFEVLPEEMVQPLILMEIYALITFLIAFIVLKSSKKAGIAASFIIGFSLCFEQFRKLLAQAAALVHGEIPDYVTLVLFLGILSGALALIFYKPKATADDTLEMINERDEAKFARMHIAFNFMCVILVALNVVPLAYSEYEQAQTQKKMVEIFNAPFNQTRLDEKAPKPDVYYIILDAFASHDSLKEFGGYDNSAFNQFLEKRGFNVIAKPTSNYDRTPFSISSSMNMQYIDEVPKVLGKDYVADNVYYRLIQNGAVLRLFKKLGYQIVNISAGSFATDHIPMADQNLTVNFGNHFTTCMMMLTPLLAVEKDIHLMRDGYCQRRLAPKFLLPKVLPMPGPKFVMVHTDLPHPPSIFDEKGNELELPRELLNDHSTDTKAYVAQLKYCESEVEKWIDLLLSQPNKPIIIVQSDHGLYYPKEKTVDYYNEVMRITNALYLPPSKPTEATKSENSDNLSYKDSGKDSGKHSGTEPYTTMTPVNSFRIVFNKYFNANLPLLPDKAFCSPDRGNPYNWSDVTPQLKFSSQN